MATEGPRYPGTTASLANAGSSENANAWTNTGNIAADDGTEASITAATYDSPDISELLVASNFGFTVPDDSTIVGITVEIDRRDQAIGAASDNRVQLAKGTTFASLVGNNKADTALDWPTSSTVKTYGANNDLWGATWTPAEIRASSFAVMLSVQADAANTDIFVDFLRVTVDYTPPNAAGTATVSLASTTVAGTGAEEFTATAASTLAAVTVDATGAQVFTATSAVSLAAATFDATGNHEEGAVVNPEGTSDVTLAATTMDAVGTEVFTATADVTLAGVAFAATGVETLTATSAISLAGLAVSATGIGGEDDEVIPFIAARNRKLLEQSRRAAEGDDVETALLLDWL